jgi:hypothetical protein
MMYLNVQLSDAQAAGDCSPTIRRLSRDHCAKIQQLTLDELIAGGYGWTTERHIGRELAKGHDSYEIYEITSEQAATHAVASKRRDAEIARVL